MPKAKLLILLAAVAALGSLALSGVAEAHSRPVRFDPAPGSVLNEAPSSITGWFTSDLRRAPESFIQVLDTGGANVATGDIQLSTDRRQMSVALQPGLGEGRYVVYWSSFDDGDGEVFSGCYAFFVGQAAADEAVTNGQSLDAAAECPSVGEAGDGEMADNAASLQIDVSVSGSSATVTMSPANFTPRPPDGSTVDPNFGHYHIYLDKVPDDVFATHSHEEPATSSDSTPMADDNSSGLAENPLMWVENSHTFDNLAPGVHTISVALFHDDHTPFDPPVIASQSFTIGGSGSDGGGIPAWTLVLAIAGGLVVGAVGMKLAGGRA